MMDPKAQALRLLAELKDDLDRLVKCHEQVCQSAQSLGAFGGVQSVAAGGSAQAQLMAATKQMQGMNQSFNPQYLKLQQKMQGDSRQFTTLSNIMKTKHDTAKNAINNIR